MLLISLLIPLTACGSIPEKNPEDGLIVGLRAGTYDLSLRDTDGIIGAELSDVEHPDAVLKVQVVTKDKQVFTGNITSGDVVILPAGAVPLSVSVTSDPPTGQLDPPPGGEKALQGPGSPPPQEYAPYRVALFSVDQLAPTDRWDTYGDFTLLAQDADAAHQVVQQWAQAHGQDAALNNQLSIHEAWTVRAAAGQNPGFEVTALNDQQSITGGLFVYENGSSLPLQWAASAPGPSGLWEAKSFVPATLFPADGAGFLAGSFEVQLQSASRHDGLKTLVIGLALNDVQAP